MTYTLDQAFTQLAILAQGIPTKEDLLNLAKQVDIRAVGRNSAAYSAEWNAFMRRNTR